MSCDYIPLYCSKILWRFWQLYYKTPLFIFIRVTFHSFKKYTCCNLCLIFLFLFSQVFVYNSQKHNKNIKKCFKMAIIPKFFPTHNDIELWNYNFSLALHNTLSSSEFLALIHRYFLSFFFTLWNQIFKLSITLGPSADTVWYIILFSYSHTNLPFQILSLM